MTRIISGAAGGRRIKVPKAGVRPTGDRAREALFNALSHLLDLRAAVRSWVDEEQAAFLERG